MKIQSIHIKNLQAISDMQLQADAAFIAVAGQNGSGKTSVIDALRMVQLETFAQRKPHQLSGGQQQRVAIARAVVNKPRLLLLDESLSALDYKLRKQMQNELKALQRKLGITFVFVTHDQEEALTMSDRIVVMRDGKIEQDGTPREIYEEPKNLFVASFIGEINIFDATVIERLDDQRVRASVEGRECNITVTFPVEKGQKLNVLLRPEDLRVDEIHHNSDADGLIGYVESFGSMREEVAGLVRPTWTEGHTLMLNLHVVTCLIVTMHSLLKTEQWSCTKRYITRMHNI